VIATGVHAGVGVGVGVGLGVGVVDLVGLGVGVGGGDGVAGEPRQIATLAIANGGGVAAGPPLEPPPQLNKSAAATKDSTGANTKLLRHQIIEH